MKVLSLVAILVALSAVVSGCVNEGPHPEPTNVSDAPSTGPAMLVAVEQDVARKDASHSKAVSEAVRNYLRDALDESLTASGVFSVVEVEPGIIEHFDLPHLSASIVSVRKHDIAFNIGPFASVQKAVLDAKMEIQLTRPSQPPLVFTGQSRVAESEKALIVTPKQFTDWDFDDSWASVACREALQDACNKLTNKIKADQRALPAPAITRNFQVPGAVGTAGRPASGTGSTVGNGFFATGD